ncbi:taurine dioxygenase [Micromonospora rosaria]|uniref:Taurine dioxygenase n=1 Tax=Micromonospora rosaria TaxID=47874 RepID=A0A136PZU3_9ACTN|nr:TauD/TfdA family dioxygenase [Micromonospora rosaria]KXK63955.1 taurine dioxygenase [Micromonospora rosaria]
MSTPQTGDIDVRRVATCLGAEIGGVDLSRPLSDRVVAQITDALHRHRVIFFRDQHLDHASHVALGRRFGELTYAHPHDEAPPAGYPEIFTVDPNWNRERYGDDYLTANRRRQYTYLTGWHTDITPAVNPPAASILRAHVVPAEGGDTMWTSLVAAYEGLSTPMRAFVDTLRAEHRYGGRDWPAGNGEYARRINDNPLIAVHPVIRVHPYTGERGLFVNPGFTSHIVDLSPRESRAVLDVLFDELTRPEYTVRLRWEPGTVAFWDNRTTAHLAPRDLNRIEGGRTLYRVTLVGERPVGPDGRPSDLVAGEPYGSERTVVLSG